MRAAILCLVAACGDNLAAPIDAPGDATAGCTARFRGNFTETSTADANCAVLTPALELDVPSATLAAPLQVAIDLGPVPVPGTYSSELVASWSAVALQRIDNGGCQYSAGAQAIPSGSFSLELNSVDDRRPHGSLRILQYVLTLPGTDCGDHDTEMVELEF